MKFLDLTSITPGATIHIRPKRIISMWRIDKRTLKSDVIISPGDDEKPFTIIHSEHGVRDSVLETPERIKEMLLDLGE